MNLLSNAIDATPAGGMVTVRTGAKDGRVKIEVIDTGVGIPDEMREKLFDPFFTTKPIGQGTGLGLSISYGIVHDHGGTIEVDSTPGAGTAFTITLPLCGPVQPKADAKRDPTATGILVPSADKSVEEAAS